MSAGFVKIGLEEYADLHIRSNPGTDRADFLNRLRGALEARRRGVRCRCGENIWVIGSAELGYSCFTCITGEASPDQDYEIAEAVDLQPAQPPRPAKRS